ncbi:Ktr system potassium uptake protein A [Symmachiella macrocystis]|uniref:Ktr system potassium uptake protein A n=1 Tax=Symmachiella macrocystis TaxID=2527985 RepID=A0A5C6BHY1_9PLAN|nr:potassium channel protein [Symmachiella macrocystis]TWU11580.1 Ktr system potassium uptake protein A [Symmachiella macrocystis]
MGSEASAPYVAPISPFLRKSGPFRKIVTGMALFLAICVIAITGYVAAGWGLADSIYMVIITIFGVGYGEVHPIDSPGLRALTIMVIIAGYGAVIYTVGGFMQMLVDGELNQALGARKMAKEIERLKGHTIICGVGRMGSILARDLYAAQKPFVIIDSDERRRHAAEAQGYRVINGDATEEYILEQAGIRHAAVLATVLSADTTNVFVTITAREMNPDVLIIARGENPRTEKKLLGCGANRVVLPTAIGATKVAQLIIRPTAENMLEQITHQSSMQEELGHIGLQFDELAIGPGSVMENKPLSDIEVRGNHGFLIVGVRHADGSLALNVSTDTKLVQGDVVIVLGYKSDIPQLAAKVSAKTNVLTYRGVSVQT